MVLVGDRGLRCSHCVRGVVRAEKAAARSAGQTRARGGARRGVAGKAWRRCSGGAGQESPACWQQELPARRQELRSRARRSAAWWRHPAAIPSATPHSEQTSGDPQTGSYTQQPLISDTFSATAPYAALGEEQRQQREAGQAQPQRPPHGPQQTGGGQPVNAVMTGTRGCAPLRPEMRERRALDELCSGSSPRHGQPPGSLGGAAARPPPCRGPAGAGQSPRAQSASQKRAGAPPTRGVAPRAQTLRSGTTPAGNPAIPPPMSRTQTAPRAQAKPLPPPRAQEAGGGARHAVGDRLEVLRSSGAWTACTVTDVAQDGYLVDVDDEYLSKKIEVDLAAELLRRPPAAPAAAAADSTAAAAPARQPSQSLAAVVLQSLVPQLRAPQSTGGDLSQTMPAGELAADPPSPRNMSPRASSAFRPADSSTADVAGGKPRQSRVRISDVVVVGDGAQPATPRAATRAGAVKSALKEDAWV